MSEKKDKKRRSLGSFSLDDEEILKLAFDGNSELDIATLTGLSETELRRRFGGLLKVAKARGKAYLRDYQMRQAAKNAAMAIHLGKHRLGQIDKPETKSEEVPENLKELAQELFNISKKPKHED